MRMCCRTSYAGARRGALNECDPRSHPRHPRDFRVPTATARVGSPRHHSEHYEAAKRATERRSFSRGCPHPPTLRPPHSSRLRPCECRSSSRSTRERLCCSSRSVWSVCEFKATGDQSRRRGLHRRVAFSVTHHTDNGSAQLGSIHAHVQRTRTRTAAYTHTYGEALSDADQSAEKRTRSIACPCQGTNMRIDSSEWNTRSRRGSTHAYLALTTLFPGALVDLHLLLQRLFLLFLLVLVVLARALRRLSVQCVRVRLVWLLLRCVVVLLPRVLDLH